MKTVTHVVETEINGTNRNIEIKIKNHNLRKSEVEDLCARIEDLIHEFYKEANEKKDSESYDWDEITSNLIRLFKSDPKLEETLDDMIEDDDLAIELREMAQQFKEKLVK